MHEKLFNLKLQLQKGEINRRDFMQAAALLGITLGASEILAACSPPATGGVIPSPTPTYPFGAEVDYNAIIAVDVENNNPDELYQMDEMVTPQAETITTPEPALTPNAVAKKKILWRCDVCGELFTNEDFFKVHAAKAHVKRMPLIHQVDEPTYKQFVVGKIERFDERNTCFNRNWWDGPYIIKLKKAMARAPIDDWDRFEGRALAAGAIFVDDKAGSVNPEVLWL